MKSTMSGRRNLVIAGVASLLVVATIVASSSSSPKKPAYTTDKESPQSLHSTSAQPKTTSTPTPAATAIKQTVHLAGFGATIDEWNSNHITDTRFATNTAYNPTPGLGESDRYNDAYYGVNVIGGRVTEYSMRLPHNTAIATAEDMVLKSEFPSDAKILWAMNQDSESCTQMEVSSSLLGSVLGVSGQALVEFQSPANSTGSSIYNPANASNVTLMLGSYSTPSEAPGC